MKRLPLLYKKNEKKIAEERCKSIADTLTAYYSGANSVGFMNGLAGISCYFFHYSRYTGDKRYHELGYLCLEKVVRTIEGGFSNPSFSGGLAGILWIFRYLGSQGFISHDESKALEGLDQLFLSFAQSELDKGNFDFLHGALGMWMTVEGFNNEQSGSPDPVRLEMVKVILEGLTDLKREENDGSACWLSPDQGGNTEEVNMGLAHGLPSVMAVLGRIFKATGNNEIIDNLIEPGMKYLFKYSTPPAGSISDFPTAIFNSSSQYPSRMAWCYGDPGVAMAIYNTAINCGRDDWILIASRLLLSASLRKNKVSTMVNDSCLCHGSSGLSVIYYIHWQRTGEIKFLDTARYWALNTLNYGDLALKRKSYLFWSGKDEYTENYNLLEGTCGVGLSLIAMLEGHFPGWERGLLLK